MLKRFILVLSIVGLFLGFSLEVHASTWRFKWTETTIHIPVGDELGKYIEKPKAQLYRDDKLLADAKIDYAREGDWLYFLKDVDTTKCGQYRSYYKASETSKYKPGTCHGYKQIITFIVEDKVKPEIVIKTSEFSKKRMLTAPTEEELNKLLVSNVDGVDNYSECEISFIHSIDLTKVGRYRVQAFVTDSDKNMTEGEFYFNVIEGNEPTITYLGEGTTLSLPIGSVYNIKELFKAFDEIDGDITDQITIPKIDTSALGEKEYIISVFNKAGQKGSFKLTVNIVDDEMPEIILNEDIILLDYDIDFESYDFLKHVKEIKDNREINYDNLKVSHNLKNEAGKYEVIYSYSDGVNEAKASLAVTLVSKNKPVIDVIDVVVNIGAKVDLSEYISITDKSDPTALNNLTIDDSKVNYDKPGTYTATASCVNSSGVEEVKQFKVIVEEKGSKEEGKKDNKLVIIMLVIILGLVGFIIYSFVIRKKRNPL